MGNNAELVRLEQFVDTLLNKYNELKKKFHSLETMLRERDDECAALKNDLVELKNERSEVGSRVSGLLGRIKQWEAEQGAESVGGNDAVDKQGSLFVENRDDG